MKKTVFITYVFCLALRFVSLAQHPVYTHLTEKDGLPDIEFYGVVEDKEGFIWLAADKGLFRYDGKQFKSYTNSEKRGLSVFGLKLDKHGRVWCNNISGQFFYVQDDELQMFADYKETVKGKLSSFSFYDNDLVVSIENVGVYKVNTNEKNKKLAVVSKGFLNFIDEEQDSFTFIHDLKLYNYDKNKISELYNFERYKSQKFNKWRIISHQKKKFIHALNTVNFKIEGKFFYETNGILEEVKLPEKENSNVVITIYSEGTDLWLSTYKGVLVYEYKNNKFNYKKTLFKDKEITKVIKDRNNNYWFTTLRDGVYIVPNIFIERYSIEEGKNNISAMAKVGENLLMFGSTKGNIGFIDNNTNKLNFLEQQNGEKVFSICDNKDIVCLSFWYSSYTYDKNKKTFLKNDKYINAKDLTAITNDEIVYATHSYASIIDIKNNKFKELEQRRSYTSFYDKEQKEIYVGYVDGVEKYDENLISKPILYKNQPIFAIDIDKTSDGTIWISTFKDGIIGVKEGKKVVNVTEKEGLLCNKTGKIKGDNNVLWIASNKGLQSYNVVTKEFKNITQKDGVNSFNISEIIPLKEDLFFSSNKGVFKVKKDKVFKTRELSDFYLTKIIADEKEVEIKDNYVFNADTKKLQFNFHTNGFLAEDNIQYTYRLLGASDDWNLISKGINQVTFNNLAGGKYTFQLKAVEINGKNETPIKNIKFHILIPFYEKWWFVLGSFMGLMLLLWLYFSHRIKKLRQKQREVLEKERMQKQLVSSKLESLQAQMNPHFTFNALNSIQNLVLKGDKLEAYDYLTKFSLLIRENLNMSKKSFVFFSEELQLLKKYLELEKLRFRSEFTYEIKGEDIIEDIKIPAMIIQPYVENAIKHGLLHKTGVDKKVTLEFYQEKNVLKCIVFDNGVGVEAAKKLKEKNNIVRESFSTKAIQERMLMLKKYYKTDIGVVYKEVNEGTKVVIKIPYTLD